MPLNQDINQDLKNINPNFLFHYSIQRDNALGNLEPGQVTRALGKYWQEEKQKNIRLAFHAELAKQTSEEISKLVEQAKHTTDEDELKGILAQAELLQNVVSRMISETTKV